MTPECFYLTAQKSTTMNMSDWQKQCEDYFGLTMEKIRCLTEEEDIRKQKKI